MIVESDGECTANSNARLLKLRLARQYIAEFGLTPGRALKLMSKQGDPRYIAPAERPSEDQLKHQRRNMNNIIPIHALELCAHSWTMPTAMLLF